MPKDSGKKIKIKVNYNDTSKGKSSSCMPTTKNFIDVEGSIKKNKEVKEKDVFNFNPQKKQSAERK
jgi:hypothetical protein